MEYLEKAAKQAKQVVKQARYQMEGLTEVEILARECTNSDPWYAGGTDLAELARASRDREDMYLIMKTLWARLDGRDDQWRNVYKAITAFEYLVANGAEEVVRELRAGQRAIERLENFHFKDERGRDQGINVRQGSQRLVAVRVATPTGDARPDASRPPARATTDRPPRSARRVRRRIARIAACLPGIDRPPNVSRAPLRPAPLTPRPAPKRTPRNPPEPPLARSSSTTRPRSRRSATRRSRTEASTAASPPRTPAARRFRARDLPSLGAASPSRRRPPPRGTPRPRLLPRVNSDNTNPSDRTKPLPSRVFPTTRKTTPATTGTTTPTSGGPPAAEIS